MSEVLPMPFPCPVCQTPVAGTPADTMGSRDTTTSSTPTPSCGCPDCNKLLDLVRAKFPHQHNLCLEEITFAASFTEDLGCDSLDTSELLMALEGELALTIFEEAPERLKTVTDLVRLVRQTQEKAAA